MWVKILLIFFVFSFLFRTDLSFDQDLGRHIKLGEVIAKTHQIPKTNLFSYTNANFPFINTHWLFEVWAYFGSQLFGIQGLLIRKVIIILFSVWLILKIVPKENQALLLPLGFIFLHVLRERLELRPEIFSFLFTALTYFILEKYLKKSLSLRASEASVAISHTEKIASSRTPRNDIIWKPILLLPIIQLIWINTHIYFFVGLILQVTYIIYIGFQHLRFHPKGVNIKIPILIFILSVLVSLINPNGLTGFLYPLNVNQNYGYTIVENQTMFLLENIQFRDPNFFFVKLCWVIIILSLATAAFRRNLNLKNILVALAGMGLSLMNVRSFPYLVFLSMPATIANFSPESLAKSSQNVGESPNKWTLFLNIIFTIILIFESWNYLNGQYYKTHLDSHQAGLKMRESIKGGVDFLLNNNLPGPIFNNFDIGSYIIYRGYPKYQVFVDGRPEAYPKEFFQNIYIPMQSDYAKFKIAEQKWGFKTIIFSHTDQTPWAKNFLQSVVKDSDWKIVYVDDFVLILVKKEMLEQLKLEKVDLTELVVDSYQFDNYVSYLRLGYFLLNSQNTESGNRFLEKATQLYQ